NTAVAGGAVAGHGQIIKRVGAGGKDRSAIVDGGIGVEGRVLDDAPARQVQRSAVGRLAPPEGAAADGADADAVDGAAGPGRGLVVGEEAVGHGGAGSETGNAIGEESTAIRRGVSGEVAARYRDDS